MIIVSSYFLKLVIWKDIKESVVERNVVNLFTHQFMTTFLQITRLLVGERNVLHVIIVSSNFFKFVIWRDIKESLLERNVLHVIIVSSNFSKFVIWRDIKESVLERYVLHVVNFLHIRLWLSKSYLRHYLQRKRSASLMLYKSTYKKRESYV